jgi:TPR repeat protein
MVREADLASARLFYERAVDAGDAHAALKLGATYDPLFLSKAGLRFVRPDPAAARHWYERGRDLGAGDEAEILLAASKGSWAASARAEEPRARALSGSLLELSHAPYIGAILLGRFFWPFSDAH